MIYTHDSYEKNNRHIIESHLVREIRNGNEQAYEELFFEYYYQLCRFAVKITKCNELARDAVQEVFFRIWENRESLNIRYSLKAYLNQAVRNHALNMMGQQGARQRLWVRLKDEGSELQTAPGVNRGNSRARELDELVCQIWILVEDMPERRKQVFELHRKHGLNYQEISEVMGIARKTVENHMGRALRELREKLDINRHLQK